MSQPPKTLSIVNDNGSYNFDFTGNSESIANNHTITSSNDYICESINNLTSQSKTGILKLIADIGNIIINSNSNASNAIQLNASNTTGGISLTANTGGCEIITTGAGGDITLLSQGSNIAIGITPDSTPSNMQTQNINIESLNTLNMTSGDMYFVSSDVISFVSATGDFNFSTGTGIDAPPIIKFKDGNVLINQSDSNIDYQLDIALTHGSEGITGHGTDSIGYNGIVVNSMLSNVASDLTLQSSNNSILSLGSFGSDNPYAIYKQYLAYQTGNVIIRLDNSSYNISTDTTATTNSNTNATSDFNNEFTYADIGRHIRWETSTTQDTITGLSTYITPTNDTSNIIIDSSSIYTGSISRIYLIQIDSINAYPSIANTFKWSNNGGTTFQAQFVPINTTSPYNILDYGLTIRFTASTGYTMKQQFIFQTKITALVNTTLSSALSPSTPKLLYTLQPFYSYIKTITPSDIVIKTNNQEKLRITGDGSIGIQTPIPTACLDLNSNYNKVLLVNQIITGYQVNPSTSHLTSGGYITVWNSQDITDVSPAPTHFDVIGQRYLSDGLPYGSNFTINNTTSLNQSFPSVAGQRLNNSNHYIVVWTSNTLVSTSPTNTYLYKVFCQIYHNNIPIRSYDIQIDTLNSTTSDQRNARVAGLYEYQGAGNYIIVWSADDTGSGSGVYSIKGCIISDTGALITNKLNISDIVGNTTKHAKFPYVAGLPTNDKYLPSGFAVGYMVAVDTTADPRYTVSLRVMNPNGTPSIDSPNEIAITAEGSSTISSISDGLLSLAELNLQQVNPNNNDNGNGGFIITFYRNYQADLTLYTIGDPVIGKLSGATASISAIDTINKIITLQNISNRFLISEEIEIFSSIEGVNKVIEKIAAITFTTDTTGTITLDIGSKSVVAYRFNSNLTSSASALWNIQINTTLLYTDTDSANGDPNIFIYKRPLSAITIDNIGTACITWSNGSIPSIYYQLFDAQTGTFINTEQRIITQYAGLKQRGQTITHLQSINGNDYGFVILWDNQSLDLLTTGIYQQLIGYNHSLVNIADGNSNFIFNHQNQCGVGTNNPLANLHIQSQNTTEYNDPANPCTVILQNTNKHIITNIASLSASVTASSSAYGLQNISFKNGNNDVLNVISSSNSLRYDDLYPLPEHLIAFYKFDETQGTQAKDSSAAATFRANNSPIYINTSAILKNFDIETCWCDGLINNCLLLNGIGINNYLFVESTAKNFLNTFLETKHKLSVSVWVNIPIPPASSSTGVLGIDYVIISNGGNMNISGTYIIGLKNYNEYIFENLAPYISVSLLYNGAVFRAEAMLIPTSTTPSITDNKWHNITATANIYPGSGIDTNTYLNIYVDGVLNSTGVFTMSTIAGGEHSTMKTYIGSSNGYTDFFRGYIDELRIYDTVLTEDLILELYNYGNPNIAQKGSLFINANDTQSHNLGIVLDDTGKLNNLNARPLPYTLVSGNLIAYNSNTTITGINTKFTTELTIGDILTLDIAQQDAPEYTIISIASDTLLTLDTRGYNGVESSITYQTVLRRPSIFTFFDNGDKIKGNIDNYGNMIIGNGKASSMLEVCGTSNSIKNKPEITLTNITNENSNFSRKTAINFNSIDMNDILDPHIKLGHIETSHDGSASDNKGIMRFFTNDGTTENNIMSLSSNGRVGIGGQNSPLSIIHATTTSNIADCSMILQSNYSVITNVDPVISSINDERSYILFAGLSSITETGDTNISKKVLSAISGSNDSNSKTLNGRLDLLTNDYDKTAKNGIEPRMSITHTGNVGINIINPTNLLSVSPEIRNIAGDLNTINTISYNNSGGANTSTITVSNNIFDNTAESNSLLIGGTFIINNTEFTQGIINTITAQNQFTAIGDYTSTGISAISNTGKYIYVHRAGLNVNNKGYIGINTSTANSPLTVNGSISMPIMIITGSITLNDTHYTVIANPPNALSSITLPINTDYRIKGRIYIIKNISIYTISITGNGNTIDSSSSPYSLTANQRINIQNDGSNWWIIG